MRRFPTGRFSAWMRRIAACVLLAATPALAACGTRREVPQVSAVAPRLINASNVVSATLPAGYNPISALAGDPAGSGIWFWGLSRSQISVFFEGADGSLKSWPVMDMSPAVEPHAQPGFAVAPGAVWLGLNSTLIRLDTTTGLVKTWNIPSPRDNPAAEAFQPSELQGAHPVVALALSSGGQVAIATSASSSLAVFDPASGVFTEIDMPTVNDEPLALAYSPSGSLGVGYADDLAHTSTGAFIVGPSGSSTVMTVDDSTEVTPFAADSFIFGASHLEVVGPASVGTLNTPSLPLDPNPTPVPPALLPGSQIAAISAQGIVEFPSNAPSADAANSNALILAPASVACIPGGGPFVPGSVPSPLPTASGQCQAPPMALMATDEVGNVWVVSPNQPQTVALFRAS